MDPTWLEKKKYIFHESEFNSRSVTRSVQGSALIPGVGFPLFSKVEGNDVEVAVEDVRSQTCNLYIFFSHASSDVPVSQSSAFVQPDTLLHICRLSVKCFENCLETD